MRTGSSRLAPRLAVPVLLLAGLAPAACGGVGNAAPSTDAPTIRAVSTEPTRVSGGDVLLDVTTSGSGSSPEVLVNGTDVSGDFRPDPDHPGHLLGLVTGLRDGRNSVQLRAGGRTTDYPVTNYPITGPIVSGPHQDPFICQTADFVLPDGSKLGPPLDDDCSVRLRTTWLYLAKGDTTLTPLADSSHLPADVATTTTTAGVTMPFVVRVETSTVDRGIYESAVLYDPTEEGIPSPFRPPAGWNRRLIAVEGFGCPGGWYVQGAREGSFAARGMDFRLLNVKRLGEGYALYANTLQHASNDCNAVLQSEAALMSKEHFIETYGVPDFTVSAGCSGGSYGSAQPADRIPGLFDGVLISCTFPDPLSIALSATDAHLLAHYWAVTDPTGFTEAQKVAVSGYKSMKAFLDAAGQSGRTDPVPDRKDLEGYHSAVWNDAVPKELRYDPSKNPGGARPTIYDAARAIYGVDTETGFAQRPFDNVGVQYGLGALNRGVISVDQFLDLNEKIGGYDEDANYIPRRTAGDPGAMIRAQQSGLQLGGGGGLASIPVFDFSGIYNDNGGYHYQWYHFALRERMRQANGDLGNYVMWRGNPVPFDSAWAAFVGWVAAYKADTGPGSQRDRVVRDRPSRLVDGCWTSDKTFIAERQELGHVSDTRCNALYPSWTFPRRVAGGPVAANILKCALKEPSRDDYRVAFTDEQWSRLEAAFPRGVCDWSKPGVDQTGVVPDGSFGPSPDKLVFDVTQE